MTSQTVKISSALRRVAELACGALLIVFTALVLYSVVLRYWFNAPPMWGEDIPKLMFVWLSFVGAGVAYLTGSNIRMTLLIDRVPRAPRLVIEFTMHLLIVIMLVVILWYSMPIIRLTARNTALSTGLSDMWTYLALPAGCVLLLINEFIRLYRILRGHIDDVTTDTSDAL
ncbi:MAG: TRAP transporter small permease [Gemmobacter sp.]|nr:TRAP transporter small permease [Gemmobacter sp.]